MTDNAHADAGTRREARIPLDPDRPLDLIVHNPNGEVTIRATDRADVLVGHVKHGTPGSPGYDESELTIVAHDNRVEVRPILPGATGWGGVNIDVDLDFDLGRVKKAFKRSGTWASAKPGKVRVAAGGNVRYDIDVEVPRQRGGRIEVHTASGDVRVEDVAAEIDLKTASGDARVARTRGTHVLHTASGDLAVDAVTGQLTLRTASGDARIAAATLDAFQVQTVSGDLLLDALLAGDGPFRAQTVSGDVRLTLARPAPTGEEPAATLTFQTVSGDARVTPPFRKTGRRLWQSGPGENGPQIDVKTVSGDLVARLAAADAPLATPAAPPSFAAEAPFAVPVPPAPPAPPAPPVPPAPPAPPFLPVAPAEFPPSADLDLASDAAEPEAPQSASPGAAARLAVLEAVERGEIDVEEALRRLEAGESESAVRP